MIAFNDVDVDITDHAFLDVDRLLVADARQGLITRYAAVNLIVALTVHSRSTS